MLEMFNAGGPVMYPLLACSLIALTVMIERAIFSFRARRQGGVEAVEALVSRLRSGGRAETESGHPLVRAFAAESAGGNPGAEALQSASQEHIAEMKRGLSVLDTVVTVAPLLGILGTVLGIIDSFEMLGVHGVDEPRLVTAGLAKALITTAAGLIIAVPSLIAYNYFVSRVTGAAHRLEKCIADIVSLNHGRDRHGQD